VPGAAVSLRRAPGLPVLPAPPPAAGPALAASSAYTTLAQTGGTATSASLSVLAGDIIVVKYASANGNVVITGGVPTASGLTFTQRVAYQVGNTSLSGCWIFTAPVTTGGSVTVSLACTVGASGDARGLVVFEVWRNGQLAPTPATQTGTGSGSTPSISITTTGANSVVTSVSGDWNADPGSRTYLSGATEDGDYFSLTIAHCDSFWQPAATAGAQSVGMTAPTGQTWSTAALEVQAAGAGPTGISLADVAAGTEQVAIAAAVPLARPWRRWPSRPRRCRWGTRPGPLRR